MPTGQLPTDPEAQMNIQVKGKQMDVGDSLRQHVQTHLQEVVSKYFTTPLDATVVFSKQVHMFHADISVHAARGLVLQSSFVASDPYAAFDEAASRIAKRLSRHKKRLLDLHHRQSSEKNAALESLVARKYVINPEDENASAANAPLIVAETTTRIENLTVSEAVMMLDFAELPALLFNNRTHGNLNMVYRRADGHIGWVDPSNAAPKK